MAFLNRDANIGNLALEILKECRHNCSGCSIGKSDIEDIDEGDLLAIEQLVKDAVVQDYALKWFELASTDILSSANRTEVLSNKTIRRIAGHFESLILNCSFLSPHVDEYEVFAKEIDEFFPDSGIEFLVPVELKHYNNIRYLEKIQNHINFFNSCLKKSYVKSATAVSIVTENSFVSGILNLKSLYDAKHIKLFEKSDTTTFVFHNGRRNLDDVTEKKKFADLIKQQNDYFYEQYLDSIENKYTFRIDDIMNVVGTDYHLLYRNGELYISPLINSPIPIIHDKFKFTKPWTLESIVNEDDEQYFRSLDLAVVNEECSKCSYISLCATRGIHRLQEVLGVDDCLSIMGKIKYNFKEDD